ncbi:TraB/GumN family protein [Qipengyuania sp. 6B39]|uniref:TraB/GumN family protein n=1 Tax=Qipengyuania proteolytica TaxID=2867239 RepID=UPI001C8921DE|nr:TraB/GumN family protein [Qipengyuania proteolytica]MBX7496042.1 TraB/GumN family protein [Qipengyuania proteolytica]
MKRHLLSAGFFAFALAACQPAQPDGPEPDSYPALWEIAGEDGTVEGWMFGTVHALPDGVAWRSDELDAVVGEADLLVVEVANLDDGAELSSLFESMAYDKSAGPIRARLDPALRDEFDALLVKARVRRSYFDEMESWGAALALAQVAQEGDAENGADRALIGDFSGRDVVELEGARAQLAIFDTLPEKEQRDLLNAVLVEAGTGADDRGKLARAWRGGDLDALGELTGKGMLADPELRQALLVGRNDAWAAKIENLLSAPGKPLIAVGAGHLLGPEGLPAKLEQAGYRIRRVE